MSAIGLMFTCTGNLLLFLAGGWYAQHMAMAAAAADENERGGQPASKPPFSPYAKQVTGPDAV